MKKFKLVFNVSHKSNGNYFFDYPSGVDLLLLTKKLMGERGIIVDMNEVDIDLNRAGVSTIEYKFTLEEVMSSKVLAEVFRDRFSVSRYIDSEDIEKFTSPIVKEVVRTKVFLTFKIDEKALLAAWDGETFNTSKKVWVPISDEKPTSKKHSYRWTPKFSFRKKSKKGSNK